MKKLAQAYKPHGRLSVDSDPELTLMTFTVKPGFFNIGSKDTSLGISKPTLKIFFDIEFSS